MHAIHPYLQPHLSHTQEKQRRYDQLYMDIAMRISDESTALRRRVGAVVVKDNAIISWGFNGTLPNTPNECEEYVLTRCSSGLHLAGVSKPTTLHAEKNALLKLVRSGISAHDATLYCTDSCCPMCAADWSNVGLKEFVYQYPYRLTEGLEILEQQDVKVRCL